MPPKPAPKEQSKDQPKEKSASIKIEPWYPYNTTTLNSLGHKFTGGTVGGTEFSVQQQNDTVKTISMRYNMKRVEQVMVTFFGDDKV